MPFDPLYLLLALPGLLLGLIASGITRSTFARYAKVRVSSGVTGAEAAARMLASAGVRGVRIEPTNGFLSDHYDPRSHTLRLSQDVFSSNSLSAVGVACHEAGHALQHAEKYGPLTLRSAMVPATQFGTNFSYILFVLGMVFRLPPLLYMGILLFCLAVIFTLVTLPVEWDASARAKRAMIEAGVVSPTEQGRAGAVLNAAFLTYVAGAISAVLTLIYYLMRSGLLGGRRS